jgi:hypothetical protein
MCVVRKRRLSRSEESESTEVRIKILLFFSKEELRKLLSLVPFPVDFAVNQSKQLFEQYSRLKQGFVVEDGRRIWCSDFVFSRIEKEKLGDSPQDENT